MELDTEFVWNRKYIINIIIWTFEQGHCSIGYWYIKLHRICIIFFISFTLILLWKSYRMYSQSTSILHESFYSKKKLFVLSTFCKTKAPQNSSANNFNQLSTFNRTNKQEYHKTRSFKYMTQSLLQLAIGYWSYLSYYLWSITIFQCKLTSGVDNWRSEILNLTLLFEKSTFAILINPK